MSADGKWRRVLSGLDWRYGLAALAIPVGLLGGSSRYDAGQIVALRPLCALMMAFACLSILREDLERVKGVAVFLGLLAFWMAAQLVPLPPSMNNALPDRNLVAEIDAILGFEQAWRPISMTPGRGWNSFASLIVPAAALCVAIASKATVRWLLLTVAALGVADAVLALLQAGAGGSNILHFYAVTNAGAPVGIFANENHSAAFSALSLLVIARLFVERTGSRAREREALIIAGAFLLVLTAGLVHGSRAGVALTFASLGVCGAMLFLAMRHSGGRSRRGKAKGLIGKHPRVVLAAILAVPASLVLFLMFSERIPGLSAAVSGNSLEDARWELWPTLSEMMERHWLVGTGFGSFEEVYHIYEPTELLIPTYWNQAHNDWAQVVIEGGLPTVLLLLGLAAWVVARIVLLPGEKVQRAGSAVFWLSIYGLVAASSAVDYPMRAPIFQAVMVWLTMGLALQAQPKASPARLRRASGTEQLGGR